MSSAAAAEEEEERMCYTHAAHRYTVSRCILVLNPALVNERAKDSPQHALTATNLMPQTDKHTQLPQALAVHWQESGGERHTCKAHRTVV